MPLNGKISSGKHFLTTWDIFRPFLVVSHQEYKVSTFKKSQGINLYNVLPCVKSLAPIGRSISITKGTDCMFSAVWSKKENPTTHKSFVSNQAPITLQ